MKGFGAAFLDAVVVLHGFSGWDVCILVLHF